MKFLNESPPKNVFPLVGVCDTSAIMKKYYLLFFDSSLSSVITGDVQRSFSKCLASCLFLLSRFLSIFYLLFFLFKFFHTFFFGRVKPKCYRHFFLHHLKKNTYLTYISFIYSNVLFTTKQIELFCLGFCYLYKNVH